MAITDTLRKEGLPWWAFAIVGSRLDPDTWKLPHHTPEILGCSPRVLCQETVDWDRVGPAVAALSPGGYRGQRVEATTFQRRRAAEHLALHYQKASKSVPETLLDLLRGR